MGLRVHVFLQKLKKSFDWAEYLPARPQVPLFLPHTLRLAKVQTHIITIDFSLNGKRQRRQLSFP